MNGLDVLQALQRGRDAAFSVVAARGFAQFGAGSRILLPFRWGNAHRIAVGSRVLIGAGSWLIVPAPGDDVALTLGDRVRMNQTSISAVESVVIEDGVALARGVYVADHAHGFDDPHAFVRDQPLTRVAPVRICRGAWLGQNVVVLPGVTIGAGAVIGANSVVRSDVPARTVAVGTPARVVRELAS
ncbi:acyltransferase [Xylanimonas protaetiae]|uniref:Acyltransferase n=1 Tax=Xylanimonas protaetiae TaxID=2509457 RepID=A0A4P6F159_9MICO|nr:acyltransferase [Xylanimonas protaetiae]QAY69500.1 acyltransferase [Xylanimonas protaetiae]